MNNLSDTLKNKILISCLKGLRTELDRVKNNPTQDDINWACNYIDWCIEFWGTEDEVKK